MRSLSSLLRMCGAVVVLAGLSAAASAPQIELDRIVSRVDGHIVTQSDVRRARMLKLVDQTASDAAAQRALETRLLILQELERAAPLPPATGDELDARRAEWSASVGGAGQVPGLLQQAGMSEADVGRWLQDDLSIRAYLRRQFGMLGEAERSRAMTEWVTRLRQRADLP